MLEAVAYQDAVPGELLAGLADAAEAAGLDEDRPQDVARVLLGGELAVPAALRLAKRLLELANRLDEDDAGEQAPQ